MQRPLKTFQALPRLQGMKRHLKPSLGCHLNVVEGFECPYDRRSYVVRGFMPLVGSAKANRSYGGIRQSADHRPLMMIATNGHNVPSPGRRSLGPHSGARPGGGARWRTPGG
ncbi:hypothetical protein AMECASPLE_032770 [Ameca splendens]|uniref:Uncharacterized protein n=1 Tax=Ameca splendens TaxID=208324 RepID=A0ABV0Z5H3_9TELE